ncbi:UDP-N-acetylmuramoylalanine--D-glutamate ligase [Methanobrevibacter sp. TMH8]|uniref:Mur ligase family protein n=1 Tax=Methanobrevibacter sp. TMH8 TaxID=2848611 RepID=UPI001CCF600F|nr:Mur ligase family protein [Methanobrevibacter sp. TMH8]MBZ9570731.1 UDP-N-acetylmuramoylalanine--D-glutamate ligase [Methanobrevibacter sp. TMH8]
MRAAVIGLGVEGKKATKSLLANDWHVYATDLNPNIDLEDLEIPFSKANFFRNEDSITISEGRLIVEVGNTDKDTIASSDVVVLSPGLWKTQLAKDIVKSGKSISDVLTKHKDIFTIGITGTNGKTTTVSMLKDILENAGKKVLVGGNAGGGFNGYCDIILEAEKEEYDILLIEVCDMTLAFCDYCFNFDLVGLTNIGNDHMNVHGSIENYKNSVIEFSRKKTVFLDKNLPYIDEFKNYNETFSLNQSDNDLYAVDQNAVNQIGPDSYDVGDLSNISDLSDADNTIEILEYYEYPNDLKVFGTFNKLNAGLANSIAKYLGIDDEIIQDSLENFEAIDGRLKVYKLNDSKIFIGKTDNSHAVKSILDEQYFYAIFIGTPRFNEEHRLDILDAVVESNPEVIVLFPGLDDTVDHAIYRLKSLCYEGRIEVANNLDEIIGFIAEYSHEEAIFIGGNGQETIIKIQERLSELCDNCSS